MKSKEKITKIVIYAILIVVLIFTLFPLTYILLSSFKDVKEIMSGGVNLWPKEFTFDNYARAWEAGNFSQYTINSVIYSVSVTIINVLFCSMVGFCITRQDFRGKSFITACYYGSMFVAGAVTLYPIFMLLVKLNLNKSLLGMILATVGMGQSFGVLMVSNYLKSIPKEIDESAIIDGCGPFKLYSKIIMPIIVPAIGVVTMITFQNTWNNYMLPLALTTASPQLRPLAVGVTALSYASDGKVAGQWDLLIAGSCMSMFPIIIIYIFANKYFIGDMMSGSIKG